MMPPGESKIRKHRSRFIRKKALQQKICAMDTFWKVSNFPKGASAKRLFFVSKSNLKGFRNLRGLTANRLNFQGGVLKHQKKLP